MLLDVRPDQLQIVQAILRKHVPQYEVWAFGSRAKWTAKEYSDLDLCIVSNQPLSFKILGALNEDFTESDLPWKVDVVDWATASASFRKIIERDKVVVQMPEKENGSPHAPLPVNTVSLADISLRITKGTTPTTLGAAFMSSGVNFVKSEAISADGWIDDSSFSFIDLETHQKLKRSQLQEGDVLFSMAGVYLGKTAVVTQSILPANTNQAVGIIRLLPGKADPRFIHYALSSPPSRNYIRRSVAQSAQPNFNLEEIGNLPVPLMGVKDQTSIGMILGALDDKIWLNRKTIKVIESVAKVIYRSWFIDFDPVRAKAEGRTPFGLDAGTAALFPEGFDDTDLGEIPSDWSATTLADIVTERTGKVGSGNGHVILSAVASGELKHSDEHFTKQVYSQDTSKYKRVEQWDYAYNPSRINIGSIGMMEEPIIGAVSPVYTVLRPAQGYEWFLRFFLDLPQTKAVINQFCSGSVRQSLSFKDFAAIPVVLPPKAVAEAFSRRWQELNTLRQQLDAQSRQLAEVRDTLLSKLMSGELRVPETLMA